MGKCILLLLNAYGCKFFQLPTLNFEVGMRGKNGNYLIFI
nr:MAG TPA: hypothetical protein [Caudoviricetes sp.]